jgi:hypothetical protein
VVRRPRTESEGARRSRAFDRINGDEEPNILGPFAGVSDEIRRDLP